jgi:hypothetical protein
MKLKHFLAALALLLALTVPAQAQTYDLSKFLGNYRSNATQDFVFVKRLTVSKDEHGSVKFSATLSGFPDDIYLGETSGEVYAARTADVYRSYLASFATGKLSVFMTINTNANYPQNLSVTSYLKYSDKSRPNVYFEGNLQKESEKPTK